MMKRLLMAAAMSSVLVTTADAQRYGGGRSCYAPGTENNVKYDGRFTFARLRYAGNWQCNQEGPGWAHDYPDAENNFLQILREITIMKPFMEGSVILDMNDPELFKYPIAYLSHPGGWQPQSESEIEGLRAYLMKGGFVIFDDWNDQEYYQAIAMMKRVLPKADAVELDLTHPIFDSFFKIESKHITGGERAMFFGIYEDNDPAKRLVAIMNLNNDLGEQWQYSNFGFTPITNESYRLGVNYMIYGLTR